MTFIDRENVGGVDYAIQGTIPMGTCATPAGTEIKVGSFADNFGLSVGNLISVTFTYANTYGDGSTTYPKLTVNGTNYPIAYPTGEYAGNGAWANGQAITFMFDGTKLIITSAPKAVTAKNTVAMSNYVTCSTGSSGATKTVDLEGFVLSYGARFNMYLQNANTSVSSLYLDVNGTGAKQIRLNGIVTSTRNYDMRAAVYECFYDGSYWNVSPISSGYINTMNYYNFGASDYKNYVLLADITTWYNSDSASETQTVVFNGIITAYREGVSVGDTAMVTMYVSYYRKYNNPEGLFNKSTSIIYCNSNAKYVSACVIKHSDKIYLAIKRNSIQQMNYKFAGMVVGFSPLLTALDTRTETIEELFVSSEVPLLSSGDGTYNLQCSKLNGEVSYKWSGITIYPTEGVDRYFLIKNTAYTSTSGLLENRYSNQIWLHKNYGANEARKMFNSSYGFGGMKIGGNSVGDTRIGYCLLKLTGPNPWTFTPSDGGDYTYQEITEAQYLDPTTIDANISNITTYNSMADIPMIGT